MAEHDGLGLVAGDLSLGAMANPVASRAPLSLALDGDEQA